MELIDIGCNLTHESFDADRDEVITRAQQVGVVQMMVTGASEHGSIKALDIVRERPGILFATAGVHPHLASEFNPETEAVLRELCDQREVVAVG
ncbi:MAG: TatD family hydrolase, partial [Xanthomonadales bacterium]|nr:TatD family hydrolase [Xanthomonadales bacterium]